MTYLSEWLVYPASIFITFCSVALKGFQHKNVIGNHKRSMFFTSYGMAAFDVLAINIIITGGWAIALTSGTGAALGMVFSTRLHDRLFKEKAHDQG